jgi:hypothetical protein
LYQQKETKGRKKMVNYSQSVIYKICCRNTDIEEIYIGSTTNFSRRKCEHKTCCNNKKDKKYNLRLYQFIRENGGWENFDMVQVEQYNATDKHSLHARERHWIEELKPSLNSCIPTRTIKEWYQDNKETISAQKRQYYLDNKETVSAKHNQYYQDNRETRLARKKQHYHQKKEMRTCVCGSEYNYGITNKRTSHYRTKKHTEFVETFYNNLRELMN